MREVYALRYPPLLGYTQGETNKHMTFYPAVLLLIDDLLHFAFIRVTNIYLRMYLL
jgi:hypothetical protein